MLSILFNKTDQNLAYRILALQSTEDFSDLIRENKSKTLFDISKNFPLWILDRYTPESNDSVSFFVNFVQSYYNWLYSEYDGGMGIRKVGSIPFLTILDIDKVSVEHLQHFAFSYAHGFEEHLFTYSDNSLINREFIRNFIKGIRTNFYQRKGTRKSYEYFFKVLYPSATIDEDFITFPKKEIFRLNGGRFFGWPSQHIPGATFEQVDDTDIITPPTYDEYGHLGTSVLNFGRIQDSFWYQDYSYLIRAGITGAPYAESLKNLIHPVGLMVFYEKTSNDYFPPGDYSPTFNVCEETVLGNYFPYRLTSTSGLTACVGCSGSPYEYDGPSGLGGWTGATFDMPTYHFPTWSNGLTGIEGPGGDPVRFGDFPIGSFIYLCDASDSPNLGLTGCTACT